MSVVVNFEKNAEKKNNDEYKIILNNQSIMKYPSPLCPTK